MLRAIREREWPNRCWSDIPLQIQKWGGILHKKLFMRRLLLARGDMTTCLHMKGFGNYPWNGSDYDDRAWRQLTHMVPKYSIFDRVTNISLYWRIGQLHARVLRAERRHPRDRREGGPAQQEGGRRGVVRTKCAWLVDREEGASPRFRRPEEFVSLRGACSRMETWPLNIARHCEHLGCQPLREAKAWARNQTLPKERETQSLNRAVLHTGETGQIGTIIINQWTTYLLGTMTERLLFDSKSTVKQTVVLFVRTAFMFKYALQYLLLLVMRRRGCIQEVQREKKIAPKRILKINLILTFLSGPDQFTHINYGASKWMFQIFWKKLSPA